MSVDDPTPRIRRSLALLAVGALALVALAGCGGNGNDTKDATAGLPNVLENLTANPWLLDPAAGSIVIPGAGPITIVFGTSHVLSGSTPCGSYRADFKLDESTITIENLKQANHECSALDQAAVRQYLSSLSLVHHVPPTTRDRLHLTGGKHLKLVYKARTFKEP
jgi:heat shock protein HslJ